MCDVDFDVSSVWTETRVHRSRKLHCCHMCGGDIPQGVSYLNHFSITDGDPCSEKLCLPCKRICELFDKTHHSYTNPSGMREVLDNCIDWSYPTEEDRPWIDALRSMDLRYGARKRRRALEAP